MKRDGIAGAIPLHRAQGYSIIMPVEYLAERLFSLDNMYLVLAIGISW
jgi:hypothetical protein